ncbi:hypothetical protein CQA66_04095 [Helicobacter aurati]|uniref:Uncharacterized protein n=1 Tax=Helicobacter aurati TaxID=137778 RepID=A0A3D8J4X5_9HELI|nr:hypothetical protein [Helicobacter aurati]RDU72503.1 hypothetical protein CQA66_04095 [Helicobacter aurati]
MGLFKEVEPDNIFRHFIWSILFISGTAYYTNTYIMPETRHYKEQLRFNQVTQSTLEQTRTINEQAQKKVNSLADTNSQELKVFSGSLNEATIRKIIQPGFLKINVRKLGEKNIPQDQLKKIQYSISGEVAASNLSYVLDIIPRLQSKHISAILDLPLSLKKNTKGNIDFSLGMSITQSTYLRNLN